MRSLSADELAAFRAGRYSTLFRHFGSHPDPGGCTFTVWAPSARGVKVVGEFAPRGRRLEARGEGVWKGRVRGAEAGHWYRYEVTTEGDQTESRADPFALALRDPSAPEAIISAPTYRWQDDAWMESRARDQASERPLSVYEVHLGSWRRSADGGFLNYREAAAQLADYVRELGFTHVEFLPLAEHPYYGSWGYQATGYFAPTARYGSPEDLMAAVDTLHRAGIGVILDWVPSHFANDLHGLARFGGECLFEHPDRRKGHHPDWNSPVFNYESGEVRSFLLSSARWWLEAFHIDGLRVDAVASMLYLDYSRAEGEWEPNEHGGRENLAAVDFLRSLTEMVGTEFPDALTIAEESTAWPGVTRARDEEGLGFDLKWDMGWMNDTLRYLARDPVDRSHHHEDLTFRMVYAFSEKFLLSLSHDEVVHMKGSLAGKMPGADTERLAQLRLLLGYMWAQPGKKLLFMGAELGQWSEWRHDGELDWALLDKAEHRGVRRWVSDLNRLLQDQPGLHQRDFEPEGFAWVDPDDRERSLLSFLRFDREGRPVLAVANFSAEDRGRTSFGVPIGGAWQIILDSDDSRYGGSGRATSPPVAHSSSLHGHDFSLELDVPVLGMIFARPTE